MRSNRERRLAALEAKAPAPAEQPDVIYLIACRREPDGSVAGNVRSARLKDGRSIARNNGENEAAFRARVESGMGRPIVSAALEAATDDDLPLTEAGQLDVQAMTHELLVTLLETRRGASREP